MIVVNCALRQDDIIGIVEGAEFEGKKPFKFNKKQGIQIHFDAVDVSDEQAAAKAVKAAIKATEFGKALFFNVEAK